MEWASRAQVKHNVLLSPGLLQVARHAQDGSPNHASGRRGQQIHREPRMEVDTSWGVANFQRFLIPTSTSGAPKIEHYNWFPAHLV